MKTSPSGRPHRTVMAETAARDQAYMAALEQLLPYERIARLVIGLRMQLGVSQEELARRVGTSPSAIARLEAGHHRPSVETLRRVAHAMDRELVIGFAKRTTGRRPNVDQSPAGLKESQLAFV